MPHAFLNAPHLHMFQFCNKVALPEKQARKRARSWRPRTGDLAAQGTGTMNAYRCPICREWHLGHIRSRNDEN